MNMMHRARGSAIRAALALLLAGHALAGSAADANPPAGTPNAALLAAATAEKAATLATLERLVNIETGTGNAEGMAAMGIFSSASCAPSARPSPATSPTPASPARTSSAAFPAPASASCC